MHTHNPKGVHQVKYEAKIVPFTFPKMYTLAITHPTTICCILPIANIACTGPQKPIQDLKLLVQTSIQIR